MEMSLEQKMLVEHRMTAQRKSQPLAYVLLFALGLLGVHRFYLDRFASGLTMTGLTLFGILTLGTGFGILPLALAGFWVVADLFLVPTMIEAQAKARRTELEHDLVLSARFLRNKLADTKPIQISVV